MAFRSLIVNRLPVLRMMLGFTAGIIALHIGAKVDDAIVIAAAVPVFLGLWTDQWEYPNQEGD